jgi:hypothetical protein
MVPACTLTLPLVWPAGITRPEGAGKAVRSWLSMTTDAPPVGAGPLRVRVRDAVAPDAMVAGAMLAALRVTAPVGGTTVTEAERLAPPKLPAAVTVVELVTVPVGTLKLAVVWPAGTRYEDCAGKAAVLLLVTFTDAPPEGAGPLRVRVRVATLPDGTLAGVIAMELRVTPDAGGVTVTAADTVLPP